MFCLKNGRMDYTEIFIKRLYSKCCRGILILVRTVHVLTPPPHLTKRSNITCYISPESLKILCAVPFGKSSCPSSLTYTSCVAFSLKMKELQSFEISGIIYRSIRHETPNIERTAIPLREPTI